MTICEGCLGVARAGRGTDPVVVFEDYVTKEGKTKKRGVIYSHCNDLCPCQHKPLGSWKGDK